MPPHDLAQRSRIRRPAGSSGQHRPDLLEVRAPEDPRTHDRQELGVTLTGIGKPVNDASRNANSVPHPELDGLAADNERRPPVEPVKRLLEPIMTVRHRHPRIRRNLALEHGDAATRISSLDQKRDPKGPNSNACAHAAESRPATRIKGLAPPGGA